MKNHCLRSLVTLLLNKRKTYLLSLLITFFLLISTRDVLNERKMQSLYVIIKDNGLFCKVSTLAQQDLFIKYKKRYPCLIDGHLWTPKTIWHSGNKLTPVAYESGSYLSEAYAANKATLISHQSFNSTPFNFSFVVRCEQLRGNWRATVLNICTWGKHQFTYKETSRAIPGGAVM